MRDQIINALAMLLNENLGNKITRTLGTGIVNLMADEIARIEATAKPADSEVAGKANAQ